MRLQPKLVLLMLAAASVPLALAGATSIWISQRATQKQIHSAHLRLAIKLADAIDQDVRHTLRSLELGGALFDFSQLSEQERTQALRLVYTQVDGTQIVALVDEAGAAVGPPESLAPGQKVPAGLSGRVPRGPEGHQTFLSAVPVQPALKKGRAVGAPYDLDEADGPRVAVAVVSAGGWVLAAELSLAHIRNALADFSLGERGEAYLVSGDGTVLAHRDIELTGGSIGDDGFFGARLNDRTAGVGETKSPLSGEDVIAAWAPAGVAGWGVVVAQPSADAYIAARNLRAQTLFWLGTSLLLAVILGVFYARRVVRPVEACADGARAFAKRDFEHRIDVSSGDEIEDLANAFNSMSSELKESIEEIERWNAELQERVEQRTRELQEAQAELFQSKKLAAVAELGAGVAHELNNPLTAVVGFSTMMLEKLPEDDPNRNRMKLIHDAGKRCAVIIDSLLRFSESAKQGGWVLVDVNEAVKDALNVSPREEADVELTLELSDDLPKVYGVPGELRTVFYHLLTNAYNAMADGGGKLTLRSFFQANNGGDDENYVCVTVTDTGKGIDPAVTDQIFDPFYTTKRPETQGLGLAVAYGIMRDHDGEITVESELGKGATFLLKIPTADTSKKARAARLREEDMAVSS